MSRTLLEGLREIVLRDDVIERLCRKFVTVEDFLDAEDEKTDTLGISKRILNYIREELRELISHDE